MPNQSLQTPQMEKLNLSTETKEILKNAQLSLSSSPDTKKLFSSLSSRSKGSALMVYMYFQNKVPEFKTMNLDSLLRKILPEMDFGTYLKKTLRIVRTVISSKGSVNERFAKTHRSMGYHNLLFIQLFKLKQEFIDSLSSREIERIWVLFVFLVYKNDKGDSLKDMLDILSTVLVSELVNNGEGEVEDIIKRVGELMHYSLDNTDYLRNKHQLDKLVLSLKHKEMSIVERGKEEYKRILKGDSVNHLFFLETVGVNRQLTPCLTPINRKMKPQLLPSVDKRGEFNTPLLKRVKINANFRDMEGLFRSPVKEIRLKSPVLKKKFQGEDKTYGIAKMYQWYKTILNSVKLKTMEIEGKSYFISDCFADFARAPNILINYLSVMDGLSPDTPEPAIKMFIKLVDDFLNRELETSPASKVNNLLGGQKFLRSVFCLAEEIVCFVSGRSYPLEEILRKHNTSSVDFWKILFNFAKSEGKSLPSLLRSRVVELEFDILLRVLWSQDREEIDSLISKEGVVGDIIVKKLLNILAERLYLVGDSNGLDERVKQETWETVKNCIFPSLSCPKTLTVEPHPSLTKNVHLDCVLLSCLFQSGMDNCLSLTLEKLVASFSRLALFPSPTLHVDAQKYYDTIFSPRLLHSPINKLNKQRRSQVFDKEKANSTPIRTSGQKKITKMKKLLSSPLIDHIAVKLEKRENRNGDANDYRKESLGSLRSSKLLVFGSAKDGEIVKPGSLFKVDMKPLDVSKRVQTIPDMNVIPRNINLLQPNFIDGSVNRDENKSGNITPGFN